MVANAECVTASKFTVCRITGTRIRLEHRYFPSVIAVLGQSLKNVKRVHLGDEARVTMALMPDRETVYCVKASISKSRGLSNESTLKKSLHPAINPLTPFRIAMRLGIVRSCGLDANGNYVGIGRLAQAYAAMKKLRGGLQPEVTDKFYAIHVDGRMVTVDRRMPSMEVSVPKETSKDVVDPLIQVEAASCRSPHPSCRERSESRMMACSTPLLPMPSVSSDVSLSNEVIVITDQKKRQREQSPKCAPAKRKKIGETAADAFETGESARVKRMGRREIIERMKKAILNSSEILTMMANIDAELFAEIVQR